MIVINDKAKECLIKIVPIIFFIVYLCFVFWRMFYYAYGNIHRVQLSEMKYNLIPFKSIAEMIISDRYGFVAWAYNLFGNIVIFIPVGLLVQFIISGKKRIYKTFLISFVIILFAEVMQLILRLGVFDVDDIVLNLAGCWIGYLIHKKIFWTRGVREITNILNLKRLLIALLMGGCIVTIFGIYVLNPFPVKDSYKSDIPTSYHVVKEGQFEKQAANQCSAFSTAYILRLFGKDASGAEVYKQIQYKIPISGYVLPKGILTYMKDNNLNSKIYTGTLDSLKSRLALGNPVIVLIGRHIRWQHYMTLVGYDNERKELYFFDSGQQGDQNGDLPGNRTMTEERFQVSWNNGLPIFNRMYITVD